MSLDFEGEQWSDLRGSLEVAAQKLPREVRFRALNAFESVARAERLLPSDQRIASFLAITAQEEAATAVFAALKRMQYPGADRLDLRRHDHKAAFWFVLEGVIHTLSRDLASLRMNVTVNFEEPAVEIAFHASNFGIEVPGQELALKPIHPFDVIHHRGGTAYLFQKELAKLATDRGAAAADKYVSKLANERNKLLYASEQGQPTSRATLESIHHRRDRIAVAIFIAIGLLQTKVIQGFAAQCLVALLSVINRAEGVAVEWEPQAKEGAITLTFSPSPPGNPPETREKNVNIAGGQ